MINKEEQRDLIELGTITLLNVFRLARADKSDNNYEAVRVSKNQLDDSIEAFIEKVKILEKR